LEEEEKIQREHLLNPHKAEEEEKAKKAAEEALAALKNTKLTIKEKFMRKKAIEVITPPEVSEEKKAEEIMKKEAAKKNVKSAHAMDVIQFDNNTTIDTALEKVIPTRTMQRIKLGVIKAYM